MDEEFNSLDAKIPKNPDKIPIKEFDSVLKEILKQTNSVRRLPDFKKY
jgi:hypothetical protein